MGVEAAAPPLPFAPPPPRLRRRLAGVVALVALLGTAHSLLYVFTVPPWAQEDEEQHLDYILELRDDQRVPRIDQLIRPEIIDSAATTDRWGSFGLPRPAVAEPQHMGLEGLSYEGYQPPLYYVAMVPVALPFGDHLLRALYAVRIVDAALTGVVCGLTAVLAAWWARPGRWVEAALAAGLVVAALPAVAEAGARVNNDMAVAVLVTAALVAATGLLSRPSPGWAAGLGVLSAAAVLTKTTGLVTIGVAVVAVAVLWRQRRLRRAVAALALGLPAAALVGWSAFTYARYGVVNGAAAFAETWQPFPRIGVGEAAASAFRRAAYPYGEWGLPLALPALWAALVAGGLVLAVRRPGLVAVLAMTAAVVLGCTAVVWTGASRGITTPTARYLVPAIPALAAAAVAGWGRWHPRSLILAPAAAAWVLAASFFLFTFLPRFPFRAG